MSKSTRRGHVGRADVIEMFSPRRSGPWHLLHVLHTRCGFIALAVATIIGFTYLNAQHHRTLAWAVLVIACLLLVLSFKFLWELTGLAIRSRAELSLTGVVITTDILVRAWLGTLGLILALVLLAGLLAVPVTRRYLTVRMWCVIDRHRLRLCLRQTKVRTMNMDGSLPLLLWAHPTKTGERVRVWTRAGSNGGDIEAACSYIASACYARDARVHTNRRVATLVTIEIIRRDPLSRPEPITSVLAKYLPQLAKTGTAVTTEGTDPLSAISVTDITTTVVNAEDIIPVNGKTKTSRKTTAVTPPTLAPAPDKTGGEDFSDYID